MDALDQLRQQLSDVSADANNTHRALHRLRQVVVGMIAAYGDLVIADIYGCNYTWDVPPPQELRRRILPGRGRYRQVDYYNRKHILRTGS